MEFVFVGTRKGQKEAIDIGFGFFPLKFDLLLILYSESKLEISF